MLPGTGVARAEAVEHRDLGVLAGFDERVREGGEAVALRPVQDDDRLLDHHTGGHADERATGEERVVQHGERVGRRVGALAQRELVARLVAGGEVAHLHALRRERRIEMVVHDAAVADHDETRVLTGLRRHRPATGRGVDARLTELVGRDRPVPVGIELVDARVAPDLLVGRGPGEVGQALGRGEASTDEPFGAGECACCVDGERH